MAYQRLRGRIRLDVRGGDKTLSIRTSFICSQLYT
jgi:hypothetical protein